ncbi:MAG: DUF6438 domain-containing protein [Acidobacteriota bacterium]|nr:DUF6438 domain-containing protein [Acidobacteriota bacterium]
MFVKLNLKNFSFVVLFLFTTLIFSGFSSLAQKKAAPEILITIERGACYGICPIYSAQISGDGTVVYNGIENVKVKGKRQFKIPKTKVQELVKAFESINYFSLKDQYDTDERGMRVADLPPVTTSISLKGKTKKVVHNYGAPKALRELEDKIDQAAGLKSLVSDSK